MRCPHFFPFAGERWPIPAMKHPTAFSLCSIRPATLRALVCIGLLGAVSARAVDYIWDANRGTAGIGGTGTWDLRTGTNQRRWRSGSDTGTLGAWADNTHTTDRALFGGTAGTVTLGAAVSVHALVFSTSGYTLSGNNTITLTGVDPSITVAGTATDIATINSVLAGANSSLIKDGAGILTLTAANTYTGATTLRAGTLRLGGTSDIDVINRESAVTIDAGTLDLGNFTEDTGLFTLNGGTITGGANAALGVNTTAALSGRAFDVRSGLVDVVLQNPKYPVGTDAAAVGLTKSTNGIVTLTRANTYTGATTITGGALVLNGSIASSSAVTVGAGSIFAGRGTTNNASVLVNGTLSPGDMSAAGLSSIGTLTTGAETWNGGGSYAWQVNSVPALGAAGTNWDRLTLGGALTINATTTSRFTLQVIGLNAAGLAGAISGFNNAQTYTWSLLSATGITGFSADKFAIDSSAFAAANPLGGGWFSVSQSGNSLNLVFTPVPEPRDYALVLGAITLGLVGLRRWRHVVA